MGWGFPIVIILEDNIMAKEVKMVKVVYAKAEIKTIEQLKVSIAKALESADTMKKKVQIACVNVMIFAGRAETKEEMAEIVVIANDMVIQLGDGIRAKGLIGWFLEFGFKQDWNKPADGFIGIKSQQHIRENFERSKTEHWYTKSPEAPFKDYNFKVMLGKLIETAKGKAGNKEHAAQIEVDMDLLEVVEALLLPNGEVKAEGAIKLVEKLAA